MHPITKFNFIQTLSTYCDCEILLPTILNVFSDMDIVDVSHFTVTGFLLGL